MAQVTGTRIEVQVGGGESDRTISMDDLESGRGFFMAGLSDDEFVLAMQVIEFTTFVLIGKEMSPSMTEFRELARADSAPQNQLPLFSPQEKVLPRPEERKRLALARAIAEAKGFMYRTVRQGPPASIGVEQ